MGLKDDWNITRAVVDLAATPIQNIHTRNPIRQNEEQQLARAAKEAPLLSIEEVRSIFYAAQPRAHSRGFYTVFGKCAGCRKDLSRTDLDPNRPYFCSDQCKEDCAYIDVHKILSECARTLVYVFGREFREAQEAATRQLEERASEAQVERVEREAKLSRRYGYPFSLVDDGPIPFFARRDKRWFEESATRYRRAESAFELTIKHDQLRKVIDLGEDTARRITEKLEYNRTHLNETYLEYQRNDQEREAANERQRQEAERPWYTPLGRPPDR